MKRNYEVGEHVFHDTLGEIEVLEDQGSFEGYCWYLVCTKDGAEYSEPHHKLNRIHND